MPKLFREVPPKDLLESVLRRAIHLKNLDDSTWFSKSSISLVELEQFLPQIEPYYMPCRAKEFIHKPLTPARAVTIIRQLLIITGFELISQEKTCGRVKGMWYQIAAPKQISDREVIIQFT